MDAGAQHIYICEHHKNVIQVKMRPFGPKTLKQLSKDWDQLTKNAKKDWQMNADGEDKEEEEGEWR